MASKRSYLTGTVDIQGCFHPIAFQLTTNETALFIDTFLLTVQAWVRVLFKIDFFAQITHTMSDQGDNIKNALDLLLPHTVRHACWFHIEKAVKEQVRVFGHCRG